MEIMLSNWFVQQSNEKHKDTFPWDVAEDSTTSAWFVVISFQQETLIINNWKNYK